MGDSWSDFVQSRPVRILFSMIIAVACGSYAVQAVMALREPNELLVESMGNVGYTVLMVAQAAVCLWVSIIFVRQAIATFKETDDKNK